MAQYSVPETDVVDGTWTDQAAGTDLHTQIVPGTPGSMGSGDDATYIQSVSAPSAAACGIDLSTVEDPVASSGHTMRWRAMKDSAGGATIGLTVALNEGYTNEGTPGTEISTKTNADLSDTVAEDTNILSAGEANNIGDYSDLTVRFVADQS